MEIAPEIIREIEKQRDDAMAENARLTCRLETSMNNNTCLVEQNAQLRKQILDCENREATCCPEDRGFEEVIYSLRNTLRQATEASHSWEKSANDYIKMSSAVTEENAVLRAENETLSASLQASANLRYGLAKRLADADLLVAGLTILTDRFERRAIKAERREVDL